MAAETATPALPKRPDLGLRLEAGWIVFCAFMLGAAAVDLLVISRLDAKRTPCLARCLGSAPLFARQIVFWLLVGALFNVFIGGLLGRAAAGAWLYGYILEYVLSIDNLFVFQAVFRSYSTPPTQVDRALFWGISAAVVLRLAFFGVGTEVLSMGFVARLLFGIALIYSGVKTLRSGDDDDGDDPTKNPLVRCVSRLLPVHESYADGAAFFVRVPKGMAVPEAEGGQPRPDVLGSTTDENADAKLPLPEHQAEPDTKSDVIPACEEGAPEAKADAAPECEEGHVQEGRARKSSLRVTPLFLVVVTLGIIDVIFAVDSVTAKVSSINNMRDSVSFFLNLSSSAFAMFVLRSLFAVVEILSRSFRFLGYGVGIVLMLIGVKLILSGYVEVGMRASCATILGILLLSILASVALPEPEASPECSDQQKIPAGEGGKGTDAAAASSAEPQAREDLFA